jgi:hypothetical protein
LLCQGSHARKWLFSRFADWWQSIHRLVHYELRGNASDSHFVGESSLLSEPDGKVKSWLKGTGCVSIIIIYN